MSESISVARKLINLGFIPRTPGVDGDFACQADEPDFIEYIAEWRSEAPCPFPELLREKKEAQ